MDLRIAINDYIVKNGIMKKHVAETAGIELVAFTQTLQRKRRLMAEEYVAICDALNVPYDKFVKDAA